MAANLKLASSRGHGETRIEASSLSARNGEANQTYCVFNKTRESFLSLNVTVADNFFLRLKGLLGKLRMKADEGVWIVPSVGVHTIGVLFAIDLIYLDSQFRVIHIVESLGSFRIAPLRRRAESVLELPTRTISSSQTRVGDQIWIHTAAQMEQNLKADRSTAASGGGG